MICGFNRDGFLFKDDFYSKKYTEQEYQLIIKKMIDIGYNFDSEEWNDNWGKEPAFTEWRGGEDFDWYKKLVRDTSDYEELEKILVLYFM